MNDETFEVMASTLALIDDSDILKRQLIAAFRMVDRQARQECQSALFDAVRTATERMSSRDSARRD